MAIINLFLYICTSMNNNKKYTKKIKPFQQEG